MKKTILLIPCLGKHTFFFGLLTVVLFSPLLASFDMSPEDTTPLYTDTDGDGVPDHTDIDDDNDGILDIDECEQPHFDMVYPSNFGFDFANFSGTLNGSADLSSRFGLEDGSVIVNVTGASVHGDGIFAIRNGFPVNFTFSGTVPIYVKASHSIKVSAMGQDGIVANDGIGYTLVTDLPEGVVSGNIGNTYFVENIVNEDIINDEEYTWNSLSTATDITFFTTNTNVDNLIFLKIAPQICNDTDGDGIPDQLDIDSDNDGIIDNIEAQDFENFIPPSGNDTNNNGLDDAYEESGQGLSPINSDGDGFPDHLDIDADNDGIPDNVEAQTTDGYVPPTGNDSDGDGLDDAYEGDGDAGIAAVDTDGDTAPDYLDGDSDNDLVPDNNEGNDFNFDGIPDQDFTGTDTDGDGLDNGYEGSDVDDGFDVNDEIDDPSNDLPDTDGTDDVNYRDFDDDGDGIDTPDEDADGDGDPTNDDTDGDGTPDYLDPDDGPDTDGDGVPDVVDIDDDNDGILDIDEDPDLDGDGDPLTDPQDSDGDGFPDHLDIDADNDGIPDNVEAQTTDGYVPPTGNDSDGDGLDDAYEGDGDAGIAAVDTDGDTAPDYLDGDSDNDLVPDNNEGNDFNFDGIPDQDFTGTDTDGDGLDNGYEGSDVDDGFDVNDEIDDPSNNLPDTDGTDDVNYRDFDDDGDGIDTPDEDADGDGDPTNDDTDGDGTPDYLDPDDTPSPPTQDSIEVNQLVTPNGDGRNDFLFIRGVENARNNSLQIFNRWGVAVYEGSNYNNINNVFDGRSQGRSTISVQDYLPSGVYFYIFEYDTNQGRITDSDYFYISR